ncbi:MAG TPA: hypothetical protein VHB21_23060 [Minicystis sp.]|nr:hypothetical protein [Minicystis sp.]
MRRALLALALVALAGCADGVSADVGADAWLLPKDGEFVRGPMPRDDGGPDVESVVVALNRVHPNEIELPFGGALARGANAAAFGLEGDAGYYVETAGVPDVAAPEFPTYSTLLSFSSELPLGAHALVVRAVDRRGHFGPASSVELTAQAEPVTGGALEVTLRWDTESDLDLRVVDPAGVEIWKGNVNSWQAPPPGQPSDPNAWMNGATLDHDSNAACDIDGLREETVSWPKQPPKGHYVVKVDAFSLCGQPEANYAVDVTLRGKRLAAARGTCLEPDTELAHGAGGGFFVLAFDVP